MKVPPLCRQGDSGSSHASCGGDLGLLLVRRLSRLAVIVGALQGACGDRATNAGERVGSDFGHDHLSPVRLTGQAFGAEPIVGKPARALNVGESVWVLDLARDPFMHVFRSRDGSLVRSLARTGQGPGDLMEPLNLGARMEDVSGVWVYDPMLRRLTRFDAAGDTARETGSVSLDTPEFVERAFWLGRSKIVGLVSSDTGRFVLFDSAGRQVGVHPGPLLGADSIPLSERARSTRQMDVCARPNGRGFAISYIGASRVDLFDEAAGYDVSASVPFLGEAQFVRDEATGRIRPTHPYAWYLSCAATDRYVYALFAGYRQERGAPPPVDCVGKFVHVFNWNGKLEAVFELDMPVDGIAVASIGERLTGVCAQSSSVVSFTFPAAWKG